MTNFIVYVEQLEYEEYEVVVEAKSIKSVEEEWEPIRVEYLEFPATISTTGPGPQPTAARSFPVRSPPAAWRLTSRSHLHHLFFVDRFLWSCGYVPFAAPAAGFAMSCDPFPFVKILRR